MTLGAGIAPTTLTSTQVFAYLLQQKDVVITQGWMSHQGFIQSLEAKLNAAQDALGRGQSETAANQLNAFVNELEAQKDQKITSEGYYLLKPIAEYLISRL